MGNIIKINIYAEARKKKQNIITLKTVEEIISKYNEWLKSTQREDKIENYEKFIQAQ